MNSNPPRPWGQAFKETSDRLWDKLPIVILVAVACFSLYFLGEWKKVYDGEKKAPIVLTETYKRSLDKELGSDKDTLQPALTAMGSRRFINGEQFVTALHEHLLLHEADEIKRETERIILKYKPLIEWHASQVAQSKAGALDQTNGIYEGVIQKRNDEIKSEVEFIRKDTAGKLSIINNRLTPSKLEKLRTTGSAQSPSSGAALLPLISPVLDEKNPLHVVYQIFYTTMVIILVCGLVATIGLLLRRLFFAGSADVLTERTKDFLTMRAGAGGGGSADVARAVIFSVAALGMGTAVAAAGASVNDKANRALAAVEDPAYQFNLRGRDPRNGSPLGPSSSGAKGDGTGVGTGVGTDRDGDPPPMPTPQVAVTVPTPQVIVERIVLPPDFTVTVPSVTVSSVNVPPVNLTVPPVAVPTPTITINMPQPAATTAPTPDTQAATALNALAANVGSLKDEVGGLRQDYFSLSATREGGNVYSRLDNMFFSRNRYMVTQQSYNILEGLLGKSSHIAAGLMSLKEHFTPPKSKKDFLEELSKATLMSYAAANKSTDKNVDVRKEEEKKLKKDLKDWEYMILRYTRAPR